MLLDLEENDFTTIAGKIVEELLSKNEIQVTDQDILMRALLEKRR